MSLFRPPLCSEREPGGYEDCTWCAAVMLNNASHGRADVPSTRAEYEALRVAGGDGPAENPGDGSNQLQAATGMQRRYGWTPARLGVPGTAISFDNLWARLAVGVGASVQGSMGAFPRGHHLRRHDPNFAGPHDVYLQRETGASEVWWMDPLAPSTYPGEVVSKSDVRRYVEGLRGGYLLARVGVPTHIHSMHGGKRLVPFPDHLTIRSPAAGRRVNVRSRPDRLRPGDIVGTLASGKPFIAYQIVTDGAKPPGSPSRVWYGSHGGYAWVHSSGVIGVGGAS